MGTKKSQTTAALFPMIVSLIAVGIVLVVAFLMYDQVKDQVVDLIETTNSTTNETVSFTTNTTYIQLTNSPNAVELSCSSLVNGSSGDTIGAGNYTCTPHQGIWITNESGTVLSSSLLLNYTWKAADRAYNATSTVQNATQDIPGWLPIIVIVIIGAVLIGLVSLFRRNR